jgi:hypothetical protein
LTATSGTLTAAISEPFDISPGVPAKLAFTTQPSGVVAGSPLKTQPQVTVQDVYGNTVTSYEGSVTLSATITYDTEESVTAILGTNTVRVVDSVAQFTDISFNRAAPAYKLVATSKSLGPATSKFFEISHATPVKLQFTVQPEGADAGTPFETQPKVAILDIYGNVVISSRASINLSITTGTGTAGATLSGTTTLVAEDAFGGLAAFEDLSIDLAGSDYTLTATSSGLEPVTSEAFNVSAP